MLRLNSLKRNASTAQLKLASGQVFHGKAFGAPLNRSGEVVFTTSLVGYPESLTDPSYQGQILVFTQPLIGNYGVPAQTIDHLGLRTNFESNGIHVRGVVVADQALKYSHWAAIESLDEWCQREGVPGLSGVDTRQLTQLLRDQGSTRGQLLSNFGDQVVDTYEDQSLVSQVSTKEFQVFNKSGQHKVALIDCGVKHNIIRSLCELNCQVTVVPHDYDVSLHHKFDGIFISNGPGSPVNCSRTIENVKKLLAQDRPLFGICMGNLLMGAALGMPIYKLKFGNRAHNQPCMNKLTGQCVITSQNHGYAIDDSKMPDGWQVFYTNITDGSNEGIRHKTKPHSSVQFHPEARGGPTDTWHLFEDFVDDVRKFAKNNKQH